LALLVASKLIAAGHGLAPALVRRAVTVELNWDTRQKSRFEATDSSGRHVAVFLARGRIARGGDVLVAEDGSLIAVKAAAQAIVVVTAGAGGGPLDLLRAAYHLGNRHVPLEVRGDRLQLAPDHALAWNNRANVLQLFGRWGDALASYDRALRVRPNYADAIYNRATVLHRLKRWDEALAGYEAALDRLLRQGNAFACACSRRDLALAAAPQGGRARHEELVYPGTCRSGLHGKPARSFRLRTDLAPDGGPAAPIAWVDRRLGPRIEDVAASVGDFVLRRADGVWAYQLAVVVDDAAQGITDVVRGEDLAGNTARQILLQGQLGVPTPRYLHTPLVLAANGEKLSKQTGALPLALERPLDDLASAAAVLGLEAGGTTLADWLASAVSAWRSRWPLANAPTPPR